MAGNDNNIALREHGWIQRKILVIGNASKPRASQNLIKDNFPVILNTKNTKFWKTSEWLENFDRKMEVQNCQILLFFL